MKNDGFYFSLEALITLSLILVVFLAPLQKTQTESKNLIVTQKMHDLLLMWVKQRNFSEKELKTDFEFVFPNNNGTISFDSNSMEIKNGGREAKEIFVESITYIGDDLNYGKITLTVFN